MQRLHLLSADVSPSALCVGTLCQSSKIDQMEIDNDNGDEAPMKIYRMKGVLHIEEKENVYIMQAVHDIFDVQPSSHIIGSAQDTTNNLNKIIVIDRNLDVDRINEGFVKCLST